MVVRISKVGRGKRRDVVVDGKLEQQQLLDRHLPTRVGVEDTKEYWFKVTALYGALYSALYITSGHRLLAPLFTHAGINIGLCARDLNRMRATPELELRRLFYGERGTQRGRRRQSEWIE